MQTDETGREVKLFGGSRPAARRRESILHGLTYVHCTNPIRSQPPFKRWKCDDIAAESTDINLSGSEGLRGIHDGDDFLFPPDFGNLIYGKDNSSFAGDVADTDGPSVRRDRLMEVIDELFIVPSGFNGHDLDSHAVPQG